MIIYSHKALLFYSIMDYPLPEQKEYFLFDHPLAKEDRQQNKQTTKTSQTTDNTYRQEYKVFLVKHQKLIASLPFVEQVYLCNSISFNALHEKSDIDLTIIVKEGKIWTVKLFTTLYLLLRWVRRRGDNVRKKFCTCFYMTEEAVNLFPTKLKQHTDIYLIYRIAHLIPYYSRERSKQNILIQNNARIQNFLPNHPLQSVINSWIRCMDWTVTSKKRIERTLSWIMGNILEKLIKYTWLPIILWKKRKLQNSESIIISDSMLKFFDDKRAKIQFLFDLKKEAN